MHAALSELLLSLLEENSPDALLVARDVAATVDWDCVIKVISACAAMVQVIINFKCYVKTNFCRHINQKENENTL